MSSKVIDPVMKSFYLCTNIPISYMDKDIGIFDYGFDKNLQTYIKEKKLKIDDKLKDGMMKDNNELTIVLHDYARYTLVDVCPISKDKGFYVIGPYLTDTTIVNSPLRVIPKNTINHLIELIYSIQKEELKINGSPISTSNVYNYHVLKAIKFVNENYNNDINLETLCKTLDINKCYFCSIFKKEMNQTFSEFVNLTRIEKSKELLSLNNMSILDISIAVGYSSQNYFNIIFKKYTGETPLKFQKQFI